jgi:hypothetical protein
MLKVWVKFILGAIAASERYFINFSNSLNPTDYPNLNTLLTATTAWTDPNYT